MTGHFAQSRCFGSLIGQANNKFYKEKFATFNGSYRQSGTLFEVREVDLRMTVIKVSSRNLACRITGAPNDKKKNRKKGLECSSLLFRTVLWPFKGIFVPANIISSVRMK